MNQQNLEYLKDRLKYLGFGDGLNNRLTEEVGKGAPEFQLSTTKEHGQDKVAYTLNFKKSEDSGMYFFNNYRATLSTPDDNKRTQTFYINKGSGVTARESYNLLSSRAVNKDLVNSDKEKYNAWIEMDWNTRDSKGNYQYKTYHQAYGFDLEKALAKHPIKELSDPSEKEKLLQSLERGNRHQVTFVKGDNEEKMFIAANPRYKSLLVYDANLKQIHQGRKEAITQKEEKADLKMATEQTTDAEETPKKKSRQKLNA